MLRCKKKKMEGSRINYKKKWKFNVEQLVFFFFFKWILIEHFHVLVEKYLLEILFNDNLALLEKKIPS